jgi:bla regulator protein blaR1
MMRRLLLAAAVGTAVAALSAQTFEVASVKPNKSGTTAVSFRLQPGGQLNALNVTVRDLIRFAYAVQPFQVEGGPGWTDSDRFDVVAKVAGEIVPQPPGQVGPVQLMMQNLLVERFTLKVRRETRDAPVYALVHARADRQLAKQVTPSTLDCAALLRGRTGPSPQCRLSGGLGTVSGRDVSFGQLAQLLSGQVQRLVIDKTGLPGVYSWDLQFAPDQAPAPGAVAPAVIDPDRPSLFTALQEQLGLKLEAQRAPLEMLVIDSVQQPTAD